MSCLSQGEEIASEHLIDVWFPVIGIKAQCTHLGGGGVMEAEAQTPCLQ